jgi:drug/metabolite transporter (DMT)-like permease
VTRKGLLLFLGVGTAWGLPYFFIALAVQDFSTPSIVWLRVALGTLVLLPMAIARNSLKPALRYWPWVLSFAVLEMVGPWWLITEAGRSISSGLSGLLITTVPFMTAFIVGLLGDRAAWHPKTVVGLIIGFAGVVALIGIDALTGDLPLVPVLMVLGGALGYAVAPIIASRKMKEVPTLGVITLSMAMVAIIYAPAAAVTLPQDIANNPSLSAWLAIIGLGLICSALAFVLFFALIKEIGPTRSTLITYVNVAVAMLLGTVFLAEPITFGILVGLPLVVIGSYLAGRERQAYVSRRYRSMR